MNLERKAGVIKHIPMWEFNQSVSYLETCRGGGIPNTVHVAESIQSCQYVESMIAILVDQIFLISQVIMLQTWSVTRSSKKQKTTLKVIPNQQGETRNERKIEKMFFHLYTWPNNRTGTSLRKLNLQETSSTPASMSNLHQKKCSKGKNMVG